MQERDPVTLQSIVDLVYPVHQLVVGRQFRKLARYFYEYSDIHEDEREEFVQGVASLVQEQFDSCPDKLELIQKSEFLRFMRISRCSKKNCDLWVGDVEFLTTSGERSDLVMKIEVSKIIDKYRLRVFGIRVY